MARENIFDKLGKQHDVKKELDRITQLLSVNGGAYTYDDPFPGIFEKGKALSVIGYVDKFLFKKWKNRGTSVTCGDLWEAISLDAGEKYSTEYLLNYCEYAINVVYLLKNKIMSPDYIGDEPNAIETNVKTILNWYGYEIKYFPKKEMALVVSKSAQTTAVAEIVAPDLAYLIVEYNHFLLKGNITRKREILLALGADLEPKRAIIKSLNKELEHQIFALLNNLNIRHNNKSKSDKTHYKEYVANLKSSKLEEWYDELYQQILLAYLLIDNQERAKKIKELIENINSKESNNGQAGNEE